ncbi:hypothetical protein [Chlorobium sp.]|nr:hypothetical protein [Chlorobium sp.]
MLDRKRVADFGNSEQGINLYHERQENQPEALGKFRRNSGRN